MWEKIFMFELILVSASRILDPDPVFKILICWIRIRPKMDRIRNPDRNRVPATPICLPAVLLMRIQIPSMPTNLNFDLGFNKNE